MAEVQRARAVICLRRAVHKIVSAASVDVDVDKARADVQAGQVIYEGRRRAAVRRQDGIHSLAAQQNIAAGDAAILHQAPAAQKCCAHSSPSFCRMSFSAATLSAVAAAPPAEKPAPPGRRICSSVRWESRR